MSRGLGDVYKRQVPGQTVTVKARSANATATKRGLQGDDNMEYVSGPEGGILLGGNLEAEGRDSNGDFTLVWKVRDEAIPTVGDSLDVTITFGPTEGSIDASLIQIDEGDEPQVEQNIEVAYIYDSNYAGYSFDADMTYQFFEYAVPAQIENATVKAIDVADGGSAITRCLLYTSPSPRDTR